MSDWSKKTAEYLKQKNVSEAQNQEKFVEMQRLKRDQGPSVWESVADAIKNSCDDLNRETGTSVVKFSRLRSDQLEVDTDTQQGTKALCCSYASNLFSLTWTVTGGKKGSYEVGIDRNGKACFYARSAKGESLIGPSSSPEQIAETTLDALLKG